MLSVMRLWDSCVCPMESGLHSYLLIFSYFTGLSSALFYQKFFDTLDSIQIFIFTHVNINAVVLDYIHSCWFFFLSRFFKICLNFFIVHNIVSFKQQNWPFYFFLPPAWFILCNVAKGSSYGSHLYLVLSHISFCDQTSLCCYDASR